MSERQEFNHLHSVPWEREEFIVVNGIKLVYEEVNGSRLIKFPGGKQAFEETLRFEGYHIIPPARERGRGFA